MKEQILPYAVPLHEYPGPKPKPIVGNLLDIPSGKLHETFENWLDQYSDPFQIYLMASPCIVSSDINFINYALKERPKGFKRSTRLSALMNEIGMNGVFAAEGEDWERQRKIIADALKPARIKQFLPQLQSITKNTVAKMEAEKSIDALLWTQRFTIAVTTALTFESPSTRSSHNLSESTEALQTHLRVFFPRVAARMQAIIPWWRLWKTPGARAIENASHGIRNILAGLLAHGREVVNSNADESEYSFLEFLLAAGFSDDVIFANALTMLLAGEDTTANTLSWALYYLSQDQNLQNQLRQEAVDVLGSDCDQWTLQLDTIAQLKWHEAVVNEVLRLKSAAPAMIMEANEPHKIPHEKGTISIEEGQKIIILTRKAAIGKHSQAKNTFQPHVWVESDGPAVDPKAFLPFGGAPRFCPGRYLSLVESKFFLAFVLANNKIRLATNHPEVHEVSLFTMTPTDINVIMEPI